MELVIKLPYREFTMTEQLDLECGGNWEINEECTCAVNRAGHLISARGDNLYAVHFPGVEEPAFFNSLSTAMEV